MAYDILNLTIEQIDTLNSMVEAKLEYFTTNLRTEVSRKVFALQNADNKTVNLSITSKRIESIQSSLDNLQAIKDKINHSYSRL